MDVDGFRIFNGLLFIGTGSVLIRSDPEPEPDPYPFQPNVTLTYKFFQKNSKYCKILYIENYDTYDANEKDKTT
jgi:hypothetical protein